MAKTGKRDQALLKQVMERYEDNLAFDQNVAKRNRALNTGLERVRNGENVEAVIASYGEVGESIANDLRNEQAKLYRGIDQDPFAS